MADPRVPGSWVEWAQRFLPRYLGDQGLGSEFVGLAFTAPADIVAQAREEAILTRSQNASTCPDDAVPHISDEAGLIPYDGETYDEWRLRITNKWSANLAAGGFWRNLGRDSTIKTELEYYVGLQGASATVTCLFNDPTNPLAGGGAAGIPPWPMDPTWWSQFVVTVHLTAAIGSGAGGSSVLLNNSQLNTISAIINKVKAADWACREVIFTLGNTQYTWDPSNLSWDPSVLTWADIEVAANMPTVERYYPGIL